MFKYGVVAAVVLVSPAAFADAEHPLHKRGVATAVVPPLLYHESQSSCAPDRGVPMWGENNAFLGYKCEGESANGS